MISHQALNRALLLIQDFEFTEYRGESRWTVLTSKQLSSTAATATLPLSDVSGKNDFAAMSLAQVSAFVRTLDAGLKQADLSADNWLVIDEKGLETSTCLVCERSSEDDGEDVPDAAFRACRLPYEEASIMFSNLDIGNMGFEEFTDQDAGEQEDGSWM
ncbi:hypothetical protein C8R44DRAFT_822459 [Mycena epipterygia]|nr:hypothetical protein C8R44DRAFT_822459 [Mycena epipterygia]